ncbi:DASH family cryptochrome [Aureispira sp. CCB-E]|uniref:DASH family cryptochrome n=1 Tax=Aureispira sp. CCB-E TaxID=3051121 RepID=UPI0028687234|nr:DASH family cryptochrome [Aureispira sp. CCB-E]WMX12941.1 DASH family cryptochrome [Aureispira sp. CCB-E]
MKKVKRIVVWFRKDLRLHDNEALTKAIENSEEVIPVYVFNEEELMGTTPYGFQKTGAFRTQFLLESIDYLRQKLRDKGIDLVIRKGKPEEEVFKLVQEVEASYVYANMERTHDEVLVQNSLEKNLWSLGLEIQFFRGKMLYYTQDLPFPIAHSPDTFSTFRKEVERFVMIREPLPEPEDFVPWTIDVEDQALPTLEELGHQKNEQDERGDLKFVGGESAALTRLAIYFGAERHLDSFVDSRYELKGTYAASRLSPWLALGCLSPKEVYAQLKAYEQKYKSNKSTQTFFLELLWRDHYRLMGKKYGDKIFEEGGIRGQETKDLKEDIILFEQWRNGKTEVDLINACMLQLKNTGFLSHKGRQLVSSYLVNDMGVHWRMGATYFQHILIDYDICSNWVNWNVVGGVGPDTKEDRYLNIENQAKRFDSKGDYTDLWLGSVCS